MINIGIVGIGKHMQKTIEPLMDATNHACDTLAITAAESRKNLLKWSEQVTKCFTIYPKDDSKKRWILRHRHKKVR